MLLFFCIYIYVTNLGKLSYKRDYDKNIPIVIDNRIKERNMGIYEKIEFSKLDWNVFWGYDSEEKYKEVESMKSVYQRVGNFLNELKEEYSNESILLVTHGE